MKTWLGQHTVWLLAVWSTTAAAQLSLPAPMSQAAAADRAGMSSGNSATAANRLDGCGRAIADEPTESAVINCLRYSWGFNVQVNDLGGDAQKFRLRPSLGLQYGRWSLGVANADDWLGFAGLRKQSSLAYRFGNSEHWRARASLSIVNVGTGEGLDSLEGGRYTLRGRLSTSYRYSPNVSFGTELAHDLLNRGGGTALTLGAVRTLSLSPQTMLSFNTSATIGNSVFWQGGSAPTVGSPSISAGLGSVSVGLGMRQKISDEWVWFSQLGTSTPIGVVRDVGITRTTLSGRIGVIKFGVW